jgi:hypothetical protein
LPRKTRLNAPTGRKKRVGRLRHRDRDQDGHNRVLAMFNPAGPSKAVDETKLVFHKYGDR